MFQTLVLILCLPSFLMPPGLCVCKFVASVKPPVEHLSGSLRVPGHDARNSSTSCRCDACREKNANSQDERRPAPSEPSRDGECPTCPAMVGVSPMSLVIPAEVVTIDLGLVRPTVVTDLVWLTVIRTAPVVAFPDTASIYISHCALLI